jgi:hypothetical protein
MGRDETAPGALDLVIALCRALEDEEIRYCHWKSNEAIDRSASGENDLDLLIDRSDADRFGEVLHRLGFKQARPAPSREVPGLIDHYGFDADSGRLVHLQAHYQLVLGDDMTKNFHLPVERAYLDSVGPAGLIRVPAPEFELAVFVVRMILKHSTWDAQLCLMGDLSPSERRELTHLLAQVPEPGRAAAIADRLPFLSPEVVDRCLRSLESPPSRRARASIARALERDLAAYARHPRSVDLPRRTVRRGLRGARHVAGPPARKRFVDGGALIAVVGPEPAVATSVVVGLVAWLDGALAVEQFRFAGPAAERSSVRTYGRALRFAGNGGISICDQFPPDHPAPDVLVELEPTDGGRPIDDVLRGAREHVWGSL